MTKAEIWKYLEQYDENDGVKVKYMRDMLLDEPAPPLLGVKPYWIAIPQRIAELADAIERNAAKPNPERIDEWTMEISILTEVMKTMEEELKK